MTLAEYFRFHNYNAPMCRLQHSQSFFDTMDTMILQQGNIGYSCHDISYLFAREKGKILKQIITYGANNNGSYFLHH